MGVLSASGSSGAARVGRHERVTTSCRGFCTVVVPARYGHVSVLVVGRGVDQVGASRRTPAIFASQDDVFPGQGRQMLEQFVWHDRSRGMVQDRTFDDQRLRAGGLNLVVAAIVLWNVRLPRMGRGNAAGRWAVQAHRGSSSPWLSIWRTLTRSPISGSRLEVEAPTPRLSNVMARCCAAMPSTTRGSQLSSTAARWVRKITGTPVFGPSSR